MAEAPSTKAFLHVAVLCGPLTHFDVDRRIAPLLRHFESPTLQLHIDVLSSPPQSLLETVDVFVVCYSPMHPASFWEVRDKWLPSIAHQKRALRVLCAVGVDLCGNPRAVSKLRRMLLKMKGDCSNAEDILKENILLATLVEPEQHTRAVRSRPTSPTPAARRASGVARRKTITDRRVRSARKSVSAFAPQRRKSVDLLPANHQPEEDDDVADEPPSLALLLEGHHSSPYSSTVAIMMYYGAFADRNHTLLLQGHASTSDWDEPRVLMWCVPSLPHPWRACLELCRRKVGATLLAAVGVRHNAWPSGSSSQQHALLTDMLGKICCAHPPPDSLSTLCEFAGSFQSLWSAIVNQAAEWFAGRDLLPEWIEGPQPASSGMHWLGNRRTGEVSQHSEAETTRLLSGIKPSAPASPTAEAELLPPADTQECLSLAEDLKREEEQAAFKVIRTLAMRERNLESDVRLLASKLDKVARFRTELCEGLLALEASRREEIVLDETVVMGDALADFMTVQLEVRLRDLEEASSHHRQRAADVGSMLQQKALLTESYIEHWERNRSLHHQLKNNAEQFKHLESGRTKATGNEGVWSQLTAFDKEMYAAGVAVRRDRLDAIQHPQTSCASLLRDIADVEEELANTLRKHDAVFGRTKELLERRLQLDLNGQLLPYRSALEAGAFDVHPNALGDEASIPNPLGEVYASMVEGLVEDIAATCARIQDTVVEYLPAVASLGGTWVELTLDYYEDDIEGCLSPLVVDISPVGSVPLSEKQLTCATTMSPFSAREQLHRALVRAEELLAFGGEQGIVLGYTNHILGEAAEYLNLVRAKLRRLSSGASPIDTVDL